MSCIIWNQVGFVNVKHLNTFELSKSLQKLIALQRVKISISNGCYISISANRSWSRWTPWTAESFVLGILTFHSEDKSQMLGGVIGCFTFKNSVIANAFSCLPKVSGGVYCVMSQLGGTLVIGWYFHWKKKKCYGRLSVI